MLDLFAALEGLISSVPEAIAAYHKIIPFFSPRADISDSEIAEVNSLIPTAHAAVDMAHQAIAALVSAHSSGVAVGGQVVQPDQPPPAAA